MFFKKVSYLFLAFSVSSTVLPIQQARAAGAPELGLLLVVLGGAGVAVSSGSARAFGGDAPPQDPVKVFKDSPLYGPAHKDLIQILGSSVRADRMLVEAMGGSTEAELMEKYSRGNKETKIALGKVFAEIHAIDRREKEAKSGNQVVDETQKVGHE